MSTETESGKPIGKTVIFGIMTAVLYAAAFAYADTLTGLFSRGALWAAAPIATVFVFSYAHGNFSSNLWSCLGVNANTARKSVRPARQQAPRPQARLTLDT